MKLLYINYSKFVYSLEAFCRKLLFIIIVFMLFIVNMEIISRSFFHYSFTWVEEIAKYLVVWTAFIGGICAANQDLHPTITALLDKLSGKAQNTLSIIVQFLSIVSLLYMALLGVHFTQSGFSVSMTSLQSVPMASVYMIIPIGCIGMAICIIRKLLESLFDSNKLSQDDSSCEMEEVK